MSAEELKAFRKHYFKHAKPIAEPQGQEKWRLISIYVIIGLIACLPFILFRILKFSQLITFFWVIELVFFTGGGALISFLLVRNRRQREEAVNKEVLNFFEGDLSYYENAFQDIVSWTGLHGIHQFNLKSAKIRVAQAYQQATENRGPQLKGLVIQWSHNLKVTAPIYIFTDKYEKWVGRTFGQFLTQLNFRKPELQTFDHSKFERLFEVHCNSSQQAQKILTPEVQDQLAHWKGAERIQILINETSFHVHYVPQHRLIPIRANSLSCSDYKRYDPYFMNQNTAKAIQQKMISIFGGQAVQP